MKNLFCKKNLVVLLAVLSLNFMGGNAAKAQYIVNTIAGITAGGFNFDGIQATTAELFHPNGIAKDANGNIYIADYSNNRIRKIDNTGIITTIAGDGTAAHSGDNNFAFAAQVFNPAGLVVDANNNIYFTENGWNTIRKIDASGIITTIAGVGGGGAYTGDHGLAINAKLNQPYGIAIDNNGVIYFADRNNHCIRKIATDNTITTVAGRGISFPGYTGDNGLADSAKLQYPGGVAVDNLGNIFIADTWNNVIRKVNSNDSIFTIAGTGTAGSNGDGAAAILATMNHPYSVAVDAAGFVYIADYSNNVIRVVKTDNNIYPLAGTTQGFSGDNGLASAAKLNGPISLYLDGTGTIYFGDFTNNRVRTLTPCSPPIISNSITGNTLVCPNSTQSFSITGVTGATSYTWALPASWTGASTTVTINATVHGTASGYVRVTANSSCGSSNTVSLYDSVNSVPTQPSVIIGSTLVCAGVGQSYSISPISNATSYVWTLPTNWTGASSSNTIIAIPNSVSGTIIVTANNTCGASLARTLTITADTVPGQPGTITGNTTICPGTTQVYSIASVPTATSYTWSLPIGWSGTSTTTSITTLSGSTSGNISVTANDTCGAGLPQTLAITVNTTLTQPGSIIGNVSVCAGTSQTYRIADVPCATSYTWTLPNGWSGTSTVDSITIIVSNLSDTISVMATNYLGNSAPQKLGINVNTIPVQPASINGLINFCQGTNQAFSVTPISNATSYIWALPNGWSGTSTTNSINAVAGTLNGSIIVTANNVCGVSTAQSLAVTVNLLPAQPGVITGLTSVDVGSNQSYSVSNVIGATSYVWTLPSLWTGSSLITTMNATAGAAIGYVTVSAINACGIGPAQSLAITINQTITTQNYIISTVAGDNTAGYNFDNVAATSSHLDSIAGVAKDNNGNVYIADYRNHRIRKIDGFGIITTICGNGTSGHTGDGNQATLATISFPTGVAVDAVGNIFIADNGSHRIRKINTSGIITTIAGTTQGFSGDNGKAINAQLNSPYGIAVDAAGNAYFGDRNNHCIRKIGTNDTITTIAGRGTIAGFYGDGLPGDSAKLQYPSGVAVDGKGNVFFADTYNNCIRKINTNEIISTIANVDTIPGYAGDGTPAIHARLRAPYGVAVDALGNVYISDGGNNVIREIKSDGKIYPIAGTSFAGFSGDNGLALQATLKSPIGVFVDATGNILIGDYLNSRVRILSPCTPPIFLDSMITGNSIICANTQQIYSINPVAGATGYTWTFPFGWTGSSSTNTLTVTANNSGGQVKVVANSSCGNSAYQKSITVALNPVPAQPGAIVGNAIFCEGTTQIYSVAIIPGATTYTWTAPSGWNGSSNSDSLTTVTNTTSGTVSVSAGNVCGNSALRSLTVAGNTMPSMPNLIIGPTTVCSGTSNIYSVVSVPNSTSYTWSLPNGWIGNSSIDSISTISGINGGSVTVTANNSCGSSTPQNASMTVTNTLQQPVSISGATMVCAGTVHTYSIAPISCATSYTWSLPIGWTGVISNNSITITVGAVSGIISVRAHSSTDSSTAQTLAITVNSIPSTPSSIVGSSPVCQGTTQTYSVINDANAIAYNWTLPNVEWTGVSSTNSITAIAGLSGGTISVSSSNSCGTSSSQTLAIIVNLLLSQPSVISGSNYVTVGSNPTYTIPSVSGALGYSWALPQFWIGTSNSTSISPIVGASIGYVSVAAINDCGVGPFASLGVTINQNITSTNYIISTVAGDSTAGYSGDSIFATASHLDSVAGVVKDVSGNMYVADYRNHRIRKIDLNGTITTIAGTGIAGFNNDNILAINAQLSFPTGVAIDIVGNIFVADNGNNRIRKINTSGIITTIAGSAIQGYSGDGVKGTNASLHFPYGIAVDNSGNVYFSDRNNHCIRKINPNDTITTIAGRGTIAGFYGDGMIGDSAKLQYPSGIAVDALGNIFFTDTYNNCIRELSTLGIISTIGNIDTSRGYSGDGDVAIHARFNYPYGVAVDPIGNVFVADGGNNVIREIKTNGIIYPIAGTSTPGFFGDNGLALSAYLKSPIGVCVDQTGTILIGDYLNSRIRQLTPCNPPVFLDSTITGTFVVCASSQQTYSINNVAGATSYTWTLPGGWFGNSLTNSISPSANSNGGIIKVKANNICGSSVYEKTATITINPIPPQPGAITGAATFCRDSIQTYSISPVGGATSYAWVYPNGWSGNSSTNSITATTNDTSGIVTVTANNSCGSSIARTMTVIAMTVPSAPSSIIGFTTICANSSSEYSIESVASTTSYTWSIPSGWNGSSITDSINVTSGATGGNIIVMANNVCGSSPPTSFAIAVTTTLQSPGIITGNDSPCANSIQTYSIQPVACATNYIWTMPSGWVGSSSTNSIVDTVGTLSGNISVVAHNSSGNSVPQILPVTVRFIPATPSSILGLVAVCQGSSQSYSLIPDSNATSYTWALPNGTWSGASSTNTINSIAGTSGGSISATANNVCGSSSSQTAAIAVNMVPPQPGAITGTSPVTIGSQQSYSIPLVSGASTYVWILPNSWTGSSTTNSINVTVGASIGNISVYTVNACGNSILPSSFPVTVNSNSSTTNYLISTIAGDSVPGFTFDNILATISSLDTVVGVTKDATGNIYIADYRNHRIRKVDIFGFITTIAGTGTAGFGPDGVIGTSSKVSFPTGVAVDAMGNVYIADNGNNRIRKINGATGIITTICGFTSPAFIGDGGKAINAYLNSPYGIAIDNIGNIYIGDRNNHCIRKIGTNDTIRTIAGKGTFSGYAGDNGLADSARLKYPSGVAVDALGNIYVADTWNNCIRKVSYAGIITSMTDTAQGYFGDGGLASLAHLNSPYGVAVDAVGNVFIADGGNNLIRKISTDGYIHPIAGNTTAGYSGDNGLAINAMLKNPIGLCVDPSGNVYVGDYLNSRVRLLAPCTTPTIYSSIIGSNLVCPGSSQVYSIDTNGVGATFYSWSIPNGWSGVPNLNFVTVIPNSNPGNIQIMASNVCGSSSLAMPVAINHVPAQPAIITGNTSFCNGTIQTYSIPPDSNTTGYNWTFPASWTSINNGTSATATVHDSSGLVTVIATNICGNSIPRTLAVTVNTVPPQPAAIIGSATICSGTTNLYKVAPVLNAASYSWTLPNGWTGGSTADSIFVTSNNVGGIITVAPIDSCGMGLSRSITIVVDTLPRTPTGITGYASPCLAAHLTYSIHSVPCATDYLWTMPAGWTGVQQDTSIIMTVGAGSGYVTVVAHNSFGYSALDSFAVSVMTVSQQPGPITGSTTFCQGTFQTFFVDSVAGATSYTWTKPIGWTGVSTTDTIHITAGTTSGNVSVTANNACGSSPARVSYDSVILVPAQPGNITGPQAVCSLTQQTYSITPVPGALGYLWYNLTNGWITSGTTETLLATVGTVSGQLRVKSQNACGTSTNYSYLNISVTTPPLQPGPIIGADSTCINHPHIPYSITAVNSATGYIWTLPSGMTLTAGQNTTSITADAGGNAGLDTIWVTAYNGCDTSLPQMIIVHILGTPSTPSTTPVGPSHLCHGSLATYQADTVSGATYYSWQLQNPGDWISNNSTTTTDSVTIGTVSEFIRLVAHNQCGATYGSGWLYVSVDTGLPRRPDTITGPLIVCQNTIHAYRTPYASNNSNTLSYIWTNPATWIGNSDTLAIIDTVGSQSGYLKVYAKNACGTSLFGDSINITVNPSPPTPSIFPVSNNISTNYDPTFHYQWYRNDTAILHDTLNNILPPSSGNYTVMVTNASGCTASSTSYTVLTTNGIDLSSNTRFALFPNPNNGTFTLVYHHAQLSTLNSQFLVTDITGRTVYTMPLTGMKGADGTKAIDVSILDNGIYYWQIKDTEGITAKGRIAIIK